MLKQNCIPRSLRGVGLALIVYGLAGCGTLEQLVEVPIKPESARVEDYNTKLHRRSIRVFHPLPLDRRVSELRLEPRIDHLFLLVDQSSALSKEYRGVEVRLLAREMMRRFVRTMPNQTYSGAFLISGQGSGHLRGRDLRLTNYTSGEVEGALDASGATNRIQASSLSAAVDRLTQLISRTKGRSAVVLVSSWSRISKEVEEAVVRLRQRTHLAEGSATVGAGPENTSWQGSSSGVCFYALGVGHHLSRTRLETVDSCGYSVAADKVAQPRDMAHFVQRVLYKGPADSDGDGIYDYRDRCPKTPASRIVDYSGCPRFAVDEGRSLK